MFICPAESCGGPARWPRPPRNLPGPPESGISSLHSISAGTASSYISIGVTRQFEGKLSVSRPSSSSNVRPARHGNSAPLPYCAAVSALALAVDAPDRRAAAVAHDLVGHDAFERLEDQARDDVADQVARDCRPPCGRGLRIEPSGASSVIGSMQPSLFGVSRVEQALQRVDAYARSGSAYAR